MYVPIPEKKSELVALLAVAQFICGCATTPVSTSEARPVATDRILSSAYSSQRPGSRLVIVKRDTGMMGLTCPSRVLIDGHPVADLATGEKVSFYVAPGDHVVGAKSPSWRCGGLAEVSITARTDRPALLRIRWGTGGEYAIQPTAM